PTNHSRLTWLSCCLPPYRNGVGILFQTGFSKLNRPAHRYLCLRFKRDLAISPARLEARMDSLLSFPVGLFHPLQHAGLSRRSPNEPSPAGCGAHPEILNPPSVGGPFFVIIAQPSLPWTSSPFPPLPLTDSTASLSSATSMLPGTPPAVGSVSSYERPSLTSPLPDSSSLITTRSLGCRFPPPFDP